MKGVCITDTIEILFTLKDERMTLTTQVAASVLFQDAKEHRQLFSLHRSGSLSRMQRGKVKIKWQVSVFPPLGNAPDISPPKPPSGIIPLLTQNKSSILFALGIFALSYILGGSQMIERYWGLILVFMVIILYISRLFRRKSLHQANQDLEKSNLVQKQRQLSSGSVSIAILSFEDEEKALRRQSSLQIPASQIQDLQTIPGRFVRGCKGNMQEARARWEATKKWRQENGVDVILEEPHPHFEVIKRHYPHFFHCRDKQGHLIYIEQPGAIDLSK